MEMKKMFYGLAAVILSLSAFVLTTSQVQAAVGDEFTIGNLKYTVLSESGTTGTTSVAASSKNISGGLVIPGSIINGSITYSVTSIGDWAFYSCGNLINITVPDSINYIGYCAFSSCSNLKNVVIPDHVTTINRRAFSESNQLPPILFSKGKKTLIWYSPSNTATSYVIPDTITHIGGNAFGECNNLTSVTIPDSVTTIGWQAFYDCKGLINVTIPDSVDSIERNAFYGCDKLPSILFSTGKKILVRYSPYNPETSYTIPDTVTHIGGSAFYECNSLANITIPDSVTYIGLYAFAFCSNLTNLIIPDYVTTIDGGAFWGCDSLTDITIGKGVTYIGGSPFRECSSLKSIVIPNSVTFLGGDAFNGCTSLKEVTIGDSMSAIEIRTFYDCSNLTSITIPANVTYIGYEAFTNCKSLTSVYFEGDAPTLDSNTVFKEAPVTVYYINGSKWWTNPWGGRPTVMISTSPKIMTQPSSQTVAEGSSVQFSVDVIGTTSFTYQWYKDGKMISDATSASYKIDEVVRDDAGNYFVIISNEYGAVISGVAVLTVTAGPVPEIQRQPINKRVKEGMNISFVVQAKNATGYQWYKNGMAIEGATDRILGLNNVSKSDEGEYFVVVSNKFGEVESNVVTLTVTIPPTIIVQPKGLSVLEGTEAAFTVEAENATRYQWYKDNWIINGATNAVYSIETTVESDSGMYYVNVINENHIVKSDEVMLEVYVLPVIIQQPESLSVLGGESATFTVKAENVTEYQWYKNGTAISGANEETYTIDAVKGYDVGEYSVVVGNSHSKLGSDVVTLGISEPYRATAELQIANGYVIGAIVTDCGWGYEFEPKVRIKDEFGEGAEAHCVVENGMVTAIILDNPGSGYSEETTVKVGSPFKYVGLKAEVKQIKLTLYLVLGETYQLEACTDLSTHDWKKIGEPFIADEEETEVVVEVLETGRYFRVHEVK